MSRLIKLTALAVVVGACQHVSPKTGSMDPNSLDQLLRSAIVSDLDQAADYPWHYEEEMGAEAGEVTGPTQPRIAGDERVTIELRGVPLAEALHLIAEHAQVNILLDSDLSTPVDASFPAVRLDDALQILLAQNDLALEQGSGDIFWVKNADGSNPEVSSFQLKSINAADVLENLTTLLGETAVVVADTNQNVILINGTERDAQIAGEYLFHADRLKPQVLLEVRIFEASLSDEFEFGITHNFDGSIDDNAWTVLQSLATGGSNFSTTFDNPGNVTTTINALRNHIGLELISAPRVMAVTNTQAVVEVIEEVPYIEATSSIDTGSSETSTTEIAFKEAGIKITVTPTIQDAGVLLVDIDQELSEIVGTFLDIPIVDIRKFVTKFLVADRQTIVLGGLMQSESRDEDRATPLLGRLPGVGRLFRADVDTTTRRELLVFVTPRILDPGQAARMAKNYQSKYREATSSFARQLDQDRPLEDE